MIFTAADIIQLVINAGLPLAQQLIADAQGGKTYTAAEFNALIVSYGTKTAAQYLADAQAKATIPPQTPNPTQLTTSTAIAP